jgi:hypothetical protein
MSYKIIPSEEVVRLVEAKKQGEFSATINKLEKGSALCIPVRDWNRRTSAAHYFLGKYNRGRKTVSVLRIGEYYYVVKL